MSHDESKCSKIVSRSATGENYVIEGNRRTWYTADGKRFTAVDDDPQYTGPIWCATSDGKMCPSGYKGGGIF